MRTKKGETLVGSRLANKHTNITIRCNKNMDITSLQQCVDKRKITRRSDLQFIVAIE